MRIDIPHQEGMLEKSHEGMLLYYVIGLSLSVFYIGLLVHLIIKMIIDLSWGIFFIGYFTFLLSLDIYWKTGIIFIKIYDGIALPRKITGPQNSPNGKRYYQKLLASSFLGAFYLLSWGIWGYVVTQIYDILLYMFTYVLLIPAGAVLKYFTLNLK